MSATPLTRLPVSADVWLEANLSLKVTRTPFSTREIRLPVGLPVYGPIGGMTCVHSPSVDPVPPTPPSAT